MGTENVRPLATQTPRTQCRTAILKYTGGSGRGKIGKFYLLRWNKPFQGAFLKKLLWTRSQFIHSKESSSHTVPALKCFNVQVHLHIGIHANISNMLVLCMGNIGGGEKMWGTLKYKILQLHLHPQKASSLNSVECITGFSFSWASGQSLQASKTHIST